METIGVDFSMENSCLVFGFLCGSLKGSFREFLVLLFGAPLRVPLSNKGTTRVLGFRALDSVDG